MAIQSTLDVDGKAKDKAQFIRWVELEPATGRTRMFAYPLDLDADFGGAKPGSVKLGDIVALGEGRFAVIEQGKNKATGKLHNYLQIMTLSGETTDLTGRRLSSGPNAGKELEYGTREELASHGIVMLQKKRLVDLRALGWVPEKAEGLARLDERTLAVINDNDFGVGAALENAPDDAEIDDYAVDASGALTPLGPNGPVRYRVEKNAARERRTQLWVLKFREPL
jgi:Esterase-like activity of phytase